MYGIAAKTELPSHNCTIISSELNTVVHLYSDAEVC